MENIVPETRVPNDEILKLNCLQMAIDFRAIDPLATAKDMFAWVKTKESDTEC